MFNSIYVEERALDYSITQQLLQKYAGCDIIYIKHYKDVFNRPNQLFRVQKQHQALILAVKENQFIYKGPEVCQDFGHENFYYTSFLLNCIYDCEYCYLQGMYPSANPVAFVNVEDFRDEINKTVGNGPALLAASYDTDLLAFHNIIPYMDYFYGFFAGKPELSVEVRTKSAGLAFYQTHTPLDNLMIAFTLSPQEIIRSYERHTPSLASRIKAVQAAMECGFRVRLCFDPVFIHPHQNALYEPFYEDVFNQIDAGRVTDVGYGFFRMSPDFFKRIEKQLEYSRLFSDNYCVNRDVVSYPPDLQEEVKAEHLTLLSKYMKKEKIFSL